MKNCSTCNGYRESKIGLSMRYYAVEKCNKKRLDQMVNRYMRGAGYHGFGQSIQESK